LQLCVDSSTFANN